MSEKLINKLRENYNDENLKDVEKHIEEQSKKPTGPVYIMVQKHTGPTEVKVSEKSREICAKVILK